MQRDISLTLVAERPAKTGSEHHRIDATSMEEYARVVEVENTTPEFQAWCAARRDKGHSDEA